MSISIQTNVASIQAQQALSVNTQFENNTIQQLTSGYRINKSGDDAAGLAVANGYRNNLAELQQGIQNGNNGISTLQIIDGGLNNIGQMLDRLKTLATESATDTFTGDRNTLNNEYTTLLTEIDREAANIGLSSAGGTASAWNEKISVHIGGGDSAADSAVTVDLSGAANQVDSKGLGIDTTTIDGTDTTNANAALTAIDAAVKSLGLVNGTVGTGENTLQYAVQLAQSQVTSYSAAQSSIRDADVASEAANLTKAQVLRQTSMAALAQANSEPQAVLSLLKG